ncbi:MAG TPA: hypothetical protein VIU37_02580 [Candidatus Limnocylindrales bacterium]
MGNLEQVDARQALGEEARVDRLLDIAHQQEAARPGLSEQDHRHVVDAGAAVGRFRRDLAPDRPQDPQGDLVDLQPIAARDDAVDRCRGSGQPGEPGCVTGPGADHARFEDAADAIPIEQHRQAGDVILVGVAEDQRVDPPIPGRDVAVERHQQAVRIGAAVDQQPSAAGALHEDAVALADVEDRDPWVRCGPSDDDATDDGDRDDECQRRGPLGGATGRMRRATGRPGGRRGGDRTRDEPGSPVTPASAPPGQPGQSADRDRGGEKI